MTKKHFIALADVVRASEPIRLANEAHRGAHLQWEMMRDNLADFCAQQNPRFRRERWLGYIAGTNGKNGGKV